MGVDPSQPLRLADIDPAPTERRPGDRAETDSDSKRLGKKSPTCRRGGGPRKKSSLLVVLQGMDRREGRHDQARPRGVNPLGLKITRSEDQRRRSSPTTSYGECTVTPATGEIAVSTGLTTRDVWSSASSTARRRTSGKRATS